MSNTYQYGAEIGDPYGPVTPIDGNTLYGQAGEYSIHATGLLFIASATDNVAFTPKSSFDLNIQPEGGYIGVAGNWNLSIANSGEYLVDDSLVGDKHNTFVAGSGVSTINAVMQPTDQMFLQGVTQADIDAAFANLAAHPQVGYSETLDIPRAGGSALTLVLPTHHTTPPSASQFHGF